MSMLNKKQQQNKGEIMEIKNLPQVKQSNVNSLLEKKVEQTQDVKTAIDLLATKTALEQSENLEKVVVEKGEELKNDAEAKRVEAETKRINEEAKKVVAEKQKQVELYDKEIVKKRKEVEQLKAESDKAQAFFDSNAEILKYIGVKNKKSLRVMQGLMVPATIIFIAVQLLMFPLTLCGVVLETLVNIVGGICGAIKNNALKLVISIGVVLLITAVVGLAYYYAGTIL